MCVVCMHVYLCLCFHASVTPYLRKLILYSFFPCSLQVPKLVHKEIIQKYDTSTSVVERGVCRESFEKYFNIYSPENVYRSIFSNENSSDGLPVESGTFGFTRLVDLCPAEVRFLGTSSFMERLLFSIAKWDRQFLDGIIDSFMESMDDDSDFSYLESGKVRAVTRMLLMPSRSVTNSLQKKLATGPGEAPFEALVASHQDRLLSNIRLLHSTYTFIPQARAPPVCSLRSVFRYFICCCEKLDTIFTVPQACVLFFLG